MNQNIKNAVEKYQCPGCVCGCDISCYKGDGNGECEKHVAGTRISSIGRVFLGMPKGFHRLGHYEELKLNIWSAFDSLQSLWAYDKFNIPVSSSILPI